MANASPKGSIIYKIIIVILAVALIVTILFPKSLWNKEEKNTKECHKRMEHILSAELLYLSRFNTYQDTLRKVVNMIKEDTSGALIIDYVKMDSVLSSDIINTLRQRNQTLMVLIDSLKAFGKRTEIDTLERLIIDSLRTLPSITQKIDSIALLSLDSLFVCPTTRDTYKITVIDTSVIKNLRIACPIDSLDSLKVSNDFILSKIGALKISNHGDIDGGLKSWE